MLLSGVAPGLLAAAQQQPALAAASLGSMHMLQHLASAQQLQQSQHFCTNAGQLYSLHHPQPPSQQQQQQKGQLHCQQHRRYSGRAAAPSSKDLADILKLQLLQGKTADDVELIWMQHHEASSSHVATVMSSDEHAALAARAAASPLFVLPLRKAPKGFCSLLIQWQPQQALVTTLEQYRQLGSNAPAHLSLTCYTELAGSHGLVLLRGDVLYPELINTAEARTVMELTRALYTDPSSYQMVYQFNHAPDKFDFGLLLQQLGISNGR